MISKLLLPGTELHDSSVTSNPGNTAQCEPTSNHHTVIYGRVLNITRPITDYRVLYIGIEGPTLTNFMLTLKTNEVLSIIIVVVIIYCCCLFQFHSYNPHSNTIRHETVSVNKMLGRRYYLVQKAKAAMTVGILVGTLGVGNNEDNPV